MTEKRITIFMGHYGSGKTFIAVNYALMLARKNKAVSIYDLDIVNPYFRTVDALDMLNKEGVELVVSPFAETNVDIPAMNAASYKMIDDKSRFAVLDIGGDDRGALALGRFRDKIKEENDYECLFVINKFRPETRDVEGVLEIKEQIERAAGIKFTGLVNNSNLGLETTAKDILSGLEFVNEVSRVTNLPVRFTAVRKDLISSEIEKINNLLAVDPIQYGNWI